MSRRYQALANQRRVERRVYSESEAAAMREGKAELLRKLGPVPSGAATSAKPATRASSGEALHSAIRDYVDGQLQKLTDVLTPGLAERDTALRHLLKRVERLERIEADDTRAARAVAGLRNSRK